MRQTTTRVLLGLTLLALFAGNAAALEYEHELPDRISAGEGHRDVFARIYDDRQEYDGVCRASLLLAPEGSEETHELDRVDSSCMWGAHTDDGIPFATYHFDFTATDEQVDHGQPHTFLLEFELQWRDKTFVRTTEHDVVVDPLLKATFDVTTDGLQVRTDANGTYTEGNDDIRFAWDWGDGSSTRFGTLPYAGHTYDHAARYTIKLDVRDGYGQTSTARQVVQIEPPVTAQQEGPAPSWTLIFLALALLTLARRT